MKEIKPGLEGLTSLSAASTLRSERSFMTEVGEKGRPPSTPEETPEWLRDIYREALKGRGEGAATAEKDEDTDLPSREGIPKSALTDRKIRDKFFNDLFSVVDSKPHEFFDRAFNPLIQGVQYDTLTRVLLQISRGETVAGVKPTAEQMRDAKEDLERYEAERRVRESAHNVNAILYLPSVKADQLLDNMQQFESLLADVAFRQAGVLEMMKIYERVLREEMMQNNGYLKPEAITGQTESRNEPLIDPKTRKQKVDERGNLMVQTVFTHVEKGKVEQRTKDKFRELIKKHKISARDKDGNLVIIDESDKTPDWEIDRTFITARAMMILSGRLLSIAAEGRLAEGLGKYHSLFLQDILQSYSPYYHLIGKYGITDTGLAAYLHKPEELTKKFMGLGLWRPEWHNNILKKYKGNELAILDNANEFFYMMRRNPNRAGDAFTWQTWRYINDPEVPSAIREFLDKGRQRMGKRWNEKFPSAPKSEDYEAFIHQPKYDLPRQTTSAEREKIDNQMESDWDSVHGKESFKKYEGFVNEYGKWVGTALRFERLRTNLSKFSSLGRREAAKRDPKRKKDVKDFDEAYKEAKIIIGRIVEIQPYQLYLISDKIRARVNEKLKIPDSKHQTKEQQALVSRIMDNMSLLETAFARERERLLNEGKTFDTFSLEEFYRGRDDIISTSEEKAEIGRFLAVFKEDFKANGEQYLDEFIFKREYTHGFVLWSGDMPLDEYKMSALGPTGSFVRRARDNKEQAASVGKEIELLEKLKHIQTPKQLVDLLEEIYNIQTHYDAGKAKANIADKAEGLFKFFMETTTTKIPGYGEIERTFGDHVSFAQLLYGKEAAHWNSTLVRQGIEMLKDRRMITPEREEELVEKLCVQGLDLAVDTSSTVSTLLALWLLLYMMRKAMNEK